LSLAAEIHILTCNLPLSYIAALRTQAPNIVVHRATDAGELGEEARKTILAALVWGMPPHRLHLLPKLALVQGMGAGVDRLLTPGTVPEHVPIARISNELQGVAMTEYVLLHVLRQHRSLQAAFDRHQRREWGGPDSGYVGTRVIGVMGLGEIGRRVCRSAAAIGFQVRGLSRTQKAVEGVQCFDPGSFDRFLEGCQHLVCLLPLTPETGGILNSRTFDRLAMGAFLINAGRGAHLVEADLIPALDSGRLGGATLDVLVDEPPPAGHTFWSDSRILLTGHSAAASYLAAEDVAPQIAGNLGRVAAGLVPRDLVDRRKGY
jgi:glyoxylate/hydroxypyruvate reductase A